MQSNSIEKADYPLDSADGSDQSQFKFRILLGEFCLYKRVFSGQIIKPNIFDIRGSTSSDAQSAAVNSEFAHIVSARSDSTHATGVFTNNNQLIYTYKIYNRMFVDVSGSYDEFLAAFRKKTLNSLKRKIKKAEKTNTDAVTIRDFTDASEVREFIQIAKPISMQSYQEAKLGTVFRTDDEWVRELEALARANRFRGYILHINDEPVAYNYCPIYGDGVLLYDLSGYIPESSKYSPGTVLQAHIIQTSFADQCIRYYDLCEGEGRHKELFASGSHRCFNAYIFPATLHYRILVMLHRFFDKLSFQIVGLLDRLGLKNRIKTFLRRMGR